jgi:hypothetical protein
MTGRGIGKHFTLNKVTLSQNEQAVLALKKPARILLEADPNPTNRWVAQIDSFDWQGSGGFD